MMFRNRPSIVAILWLLLLALLVPVPAVSAETIECTPQAAAAPPSATPVAASPVPFPADPGKLTVSAASSLTDVLTTFHSALQQITPGLSFETNFAGSPTLVTQLEEGASADLLLLASTSQMARADQAGLLDGPAVTFAGNRLVLIVPSDNPASITSAADLANDRLRLVLGSAGVPAGDYARALLCLVATDDPTHGDPWRSAVGDNIVSGETDVKAVLTKVRIGEADAGIVYATDITTEIADDVAIVPLPAADNLIAIYQIAATKSGDSVRANAYIAALLSPLGQEGLAQAGFIPIAELA